MNFNLELYRVFDAVCRAGSFSEAARELYISQPAVSQAIRQLEEAFNAKLFIRSGRGINLTAEGETLKDYVSSALAMISSGENRVFELRGMTAGELRIGAGDTVARWYLLDAIQNFHGKYPNIALKMTNRTSQETIALLHAGQIDVGFVNMPVTSDGVVFEKCLDIHDVFMAGQSFSHLKGRSVSLEELASVPLIMLERRSSSRRYVEDFFLSHGVAPQPQLELGAHHLLLDYAEIGLGVACAIREFSRHALGRSGMFELTMATPIPGRSVAACWLAKLGLSPAARKFLELLET